MPATGAGPGRGDHKSVLDAIKRLRDMGATEEEPQKAYCDVVPEALIGVYASGARRTKRWAGLVQATGTSDALVFIKCYVDHGHEQGEGVLLTRLVAQWR